MEKRPADKVKPVPATPKVPKVKTESKPKPHGDPPSKAPEGMRWRWKDDSKKNVNKQANQKQEDTQMEQTYTQEQLEELFFQLVGMIAELFDQLGGTPGMYKKKLELEDEDGGEHMFQADIWPGTEASARPRKTATDYRRKIMARAARISRLRRMGR